MKKFTFMMMFLVAIGLLFTSCAKPKGTFTIDNYTNSGMYVDWCGYSMDCGPYGYTDYTVNAGGGTASVDSELYGYWGSIYICT